MPPMNNIKVVGRQSVPTVMVQPAPDEPEPPLPIPPAKTQEELAKMAMDSQVVMTKGAMTPSSTPPEPLPPSYQFTDEDRAKALRMREKYDWENSPLNEALEHLAAIRLETERGGMLLQKRISENRVERVKCFACENIIEVTAGRFVTYRVRNNFETGLPEAAYACSQACALILNRDFPHPTRVPMPRETR